MQLASSFIQLASTGCMRNILHFSLNDREDYMETGPYLKVPYDKLDEHMICGPFESGRFTQVLLYF